MNQYEKGMIGLAVKYRNEMWGDTEGFLTRLGRFASIRNCLVSVYQILVNKKHCEPIESLPEDQKRELWNEAKRISESQEKKVLTDTCKALQGWGTFIQISDNEINEITS